MSSIEHEMVLAHFIVSDDVERSQTTLARGWRPPS
jgi:hypothetical protein